MKYFYILLASILFQIKVKSQEIEFVSTFNLPELAQDGQFAEMKFNGVDETFVVSYWVKPFNNIPIIPQVKYYFNKEFKFIKEEKVENRFDIEKVTKDTSTYLLFPTYFTPGYNMSFMNSYFSFLKKASIECHQSKFEFDEKKKNLKNDSKLIKEFPLDDSDGQILQFINSIGQSKKNDDYFVLSKPAKGKNKIFYLHRITKHGVIVNKKEINFTETKIPILTRLIVEGKDDPKEYIVLAFYPSAAKKDKNAENQKYAIYCFDDNFNEMSHIDFLSEAIGWNILDVKKVNNDLYFFGSGDKDNWSGFENSIQVMKTTGSEVKYIKKYSRDYLNENIIFPSDSKEQDKDKHKIYRILNVLNMNITDDGEIIVSGNNYYTNPTGYMRSVTDYFSSYLFNFGNSGELKASYNLDFSPRGSEKGFSVDHQIIYDMNSHELLWLACELEKTIEKPDKILNALFGDKNNQTNYLFNLFVTAIDMTKKTFNSVKKVNESKEIFMSLDMFSKVPQPFLMDKKFIFPATDKDGKQLTLYKINLNKYAKIEKLEDYILNLNINAENK